MTLFHRISIWPEDFVVFPCIVLEGWTPHQAAFEAVVKLFGVQEWIFF